MVSPFGGIQLPIRLVIGDSRGTGGVAIDASLTVSGSMRGVGVVAGLRLADERLYR